MIAETLTFLKEHKEGIETLTSMVSTMATLVGAIIIPIMLARVTGKMSHQNSLALQLNDSKRKTFELFVDTLFTFIEGQRSRKLNEEEENLQQFKKNLLFNASEETLAAFNEWMKYTRDNTNASEQKGNNHEVLKILDRFLLHLRKDIGVIDKKKDSYDRIQLILNEDFNKKNKKVAPSVNS